MVQNFAYSYCYYNELIGGVKGAFTNFDVDYQQIGTSQCFSWLLDNKNIGHNKTIIGANNQSIYIYKTDSIKVDIMAYKAHRVLNYDFAIMSTQFLNKKLIELSYPPKKDCIYIADIDDIPVSVVVEKSNNYSLKGYHFFTQNNLDSALVYLQKAYQYDPTNFCIWPFLGYSLNLKNKDISVNSFFSAYYELYPYDEYNNKLIEAYEQRIQIR